jgi:hypothetical protein
MPQVAGTVVGAVCLTTMAHAVFLFLLFLSSVSAQTIYDIVSPQFFSTQKYVLNQTLVVRYSGKRLGTATSCSQGFPFVLYLIIVLWTVS